MTEIITSVNVKSLQLHAHCNIVFRHTIDRSHGLSRSATRVRWPDFTIMPTYCVVCRTQAITQSYAGNKRYLGPYDRVIARMQQYDDTHAERNPYVRYVK